MTFDLSKELSIYSVTFIYNYRKHHTTDIIDEVEILNSNVNDQNSVDFKCYFEKTYGSENYKKFIKSFQNSKINAEEPGDELELLFKMEINRWNHIINENEFNSNIFNSKLNLEQFYSFIYFNEFNSLRLNEAKFIFKLYDLNNDSTIDFDEFINAFKSK